MAVVRLGPELVFPHPEQAEPDGLLAVGGDLSPQRLLLAYANGIFPWYAEDLPILWHSPDPRVVLLPEKLHVPRSLRKTLRRDVYQVHFDRDFARVIERCARVRRSGEDGTWITDDMLEGYCTLHRLGFAHSFESWHEGELVGGLYGVSLGSAFFGESMFHHQTNASKVALVATVERLRRHEFALFDVQFQTPHLECFGSTEIPRDKYVRRLKSALAIETQFAD